MSKPIPQCPRCNEDLSDTSEQDFGNWIPDDPKNEQRAALEVRIACQCGFTGIGFIYVNELVDLENVAVEMQEDEQDEV